MADTPAPSVGEPNAEDVERLRALLAALRYGSHTFTTHEMAERILTSDWLAARTAAAREAARAVLTPFDSLFSGGPDTACRTLWRDAGGGWPDEECVVVPMADLRATFAAARAAARVEGGA